MNIAAQVLAAPEMNDGMLLGYIAALAVGGVLLLILAAAVQQAVGWRVLNALIGLAFLGYAFYLFFIFDGGEVRIFFYALILPILLIIQAFKQRKSANVAS